MVFVTFWQQKVEREKKILENTFNFLRKIYFCAQFFRIPLLRKQKFSIAHVLL